MATQEEIDALTAQIAELNNTIASGEKQVALGAQQVTYRNMAELITARNDLQNRLDGLNTQNGTRGQKSRVTRLFQSGRGY